MKSIMAILISLIFVCSFAFAAPNTATNAMATGVQASNAVASTVTNADAASTAAVTSAAQVRASNMSELRNMVTERQRTMDQEVENITDAARRVMYQNQNRVRAAVHALVAAEDLTGGIGRNVSEIAREFNNSVNVTLRAEERIREKNWLSRFFFGGDSDAASEIDQEVSENTQRIERLRNMIQDCDCTEEVKSLIQEQIQSMEQEQERLETLAASENADRGIFGWLFR